MTELPASDTTKAPDLRKLELESKKLELDLENAPGQEKERKYRLALDMARAVAVGIGAVVVFIFINRADSLLHERASKEETKRERARLVLECLKDPEALALYRCTQTIFDAYSDPVDASSTDWLRNLRDTAYAEARAKTGPQAAPTKATNVQPEDRHCDQPDGDWWRSGDWVIVENAEQLNPEAVPHGWVDAVSDGMMNRPTGATGSMLVLHPLSPGTPAVVRFSRDRLPQVAGRVMKITAVGSPYGDGSLEVWVNGDLDGPGSAVVSGTHWSVFKTTLPQNLASLELRSAAGGTNSWRFETTFTKEICFSSS